jgi:stearoyl-CoA desaturase (delta-9 desaturase)
MEVDPRFSKNVPDWPWFDKMANSQISRVLWILLYIAFYARFAPNAWYFLFLPFTVAMGPIQGAIINWCAHKYGYRNFEQKNKSTNLFRIDLIFLGESYHHNHHKFPAAINMAMRPREFDPVYYIILFFNFCGIVRIRQHKLAEKVRVEHAAVLLPE